MKRRNSEKKQKVNPVIFILIIGAILGAAIGSTIVLNTANTLNVFMSIVFCIVTAGFGSIIALCIVYNITCAIEETQNAIMKRKKGY